MTTISTNWKVTCSSSVTPELLVPPGLVDDHDAASWIGHISRDGVDGESAVVHTRL